MNELPFVDKGVVRNLRFAVASLTGFEFKIYDDHVEVACKKSADDVFKFCVRFLIRFLLFTSPPML